MPPGLASVIVQSQALLGLVVIVAPLHRLVRRGPAAAALQPR